MATSIDKSTNWRGSAEAPDYQVAARRVDTYVQPERNTKGKQVAEALSQAAGVVSQVGQDKLKEKRIKQQASLETLEARLIAQRDADPSYNFEDDTEYKGLLEEHRIYIANQLGKDADYAYTKEKGEDGKYKVVSYEEIQDHLSKNQGLYQDPDELRKYLDQYHVPIEEEIDGANIHLQASHANSFDTFKDKIKGEGVLRRKETETKQIENSFRSNVRRDFIEGGTPQEIWNRVFNTDQGLNYNKVIQGEIIAEVAKEYAIEMKDETILMEHNIPYEIYKKPIFKYTNRQVIENLKSDAQSDAKWQDWKNTKEREDFVFSERQRMYEAQQAGNPVPLSSIQDHELREYANYLDSQPILRDSKSKANLATISGELRDIMFSDQPLIWNKKVYDKNERGVGAYLIARGGLNQTEMNIAIKESTALVEGANIEKFDWYESLVTTPATTNFKKGLFILDTEVDATLNKALFALRNDVGEMYARFKNNDGVFSVEEREAIFLYAEKQGARYRELANANEEIKLKDNKTIDEIKSKGSGDEYSDFLDNLNIQDDNKQAEPVVEDKVEVETKKPKSDMSPAEQFVNLPEKDLITALVQTPSLSFEQVEGLTPEEMLEAYPDEIEKALKQLKTNERFRDMLGNLFDKEDKPKGLTKAQQAYFDKTGKLPKSAQTK